MSDDKKKPKKLMEPFLLKMAMRDEAIIESKRLSKYNKRRSTSSASRQPSEQHMKTGNNRSDKQIISKQLTVAQSNFPSTSKEFQIEVKTSVAHEKKKPSKSKTAPSPTTISIISETSIKSSTSSISIKSAIKSNRRIEDSPSYYQRLVIPFSGFTEADMKEIRGGKEPKLRQANQTYRPSLGTNANEPRPVLKRYQSEKRKRSYDRYVKESFENYIPARNNTEDSSYNTVIAVKMMVESASKLGEKISEAVADDHFANTSKDTICLPISEVIPHLDQLTTPASLENSIIQNAKKTSLPTDKSDSSYQTIRGKLMELKTELHIADTEYEKMQNQPNISLSQNGKTANEITKLICETKKYDETEKAYFRAKLNLHRMKTRRDKLISQLLQLEEHMNRKE